MVICRILNGAAEDWFRNKFYGARFIGLDRAPATRHHHHDAARSFERRSENDPNNTA